MSDQKNGGDHEDDLDELSASDESEPEGGLSSAPFDPELDDDDDDDDDEDGGEVVLSAPPAGRLVQSPFSLRGGGSAFSNRSHSIFECLDSVARLASSSSASSSSSSQNHRPVSDGVFARPLPPPPSRKTSQPAPSSPTPAKKRGVPDYLVHPERWTRYSLEDVTETSERGNTRAAHSFLSSLQQSKEPQEAAGDLQHKMIFSRPSGLKEQPADPPTAATGRDKEARLRLLEEEEEEEEEECRKKDTRLSHLEEEDDIEEKEMAEARRTEQRGGNAEEKDTRAAVGGAEEKKKVQKGVQEGEDVPSFRKTKRKNYRTSAGQEDN